MEFISEQYDEENSDVFVTAGMRLTDHLTDLSHSSWSAFCDLAKVWSAK